MIILDTHAWIWWAGSAPELSTAAGRAIAASDHIGVCTMSCWEVGMLVRRGRLTLNRDAHAWMRTALEQPKVLVLPLTWEIALLAGTLDWEHGDPADRIIYATALKCGAQLVTKDQRMQERGVTGPVIEVTTIW